MSQSAPSTDDRSRVAGVEEGFFLDPERLMDLARAGAQR
jgi:hypothetical protein